MGGKGNSKSDSKTSTSNSTQQTDSRVAAADSGIAIGSGATVTLNDEFPTEAVQVFNSLVELASTGINTARDAGGEAITALQDRVNRAEQGPDYTIVKDTLPYIVVGIVAIVLIYLYMNRKRG